MRSKNFKWPVLVLAFFSANLLKSYASSAVLDYPKQPYFVSHPAISPDASIVVFSYEGDLWKVDHTGGIATRLTALPGEETHPKISPDGKWLAFTSNQFGNGDVFVMPLDGGQIRQLTHHDANDEVESWSWDSRHIYFTSGRYNRFSSYRVALQGGTAVRVFPHFFNTIHQVTETPNGQLLFNDSWESYTAAHRKGYKGAFNPDILSYDPKTDSYGRLTDYEGKDFWQSVDRQGNVYFASDAGNGEYNLYTFDAQGEPRALTSFSSSIKRPQVSANGEKVVFEKDYQLYLFDVKSRQAQPLTFSIHQQRVLDKEQDFDTKGQVSSFDVSPDGKLMAFVSRGALFVSDIEGKFIRQVHESGERVFEVKWMSDNRTLLFNRTADGYPNWFKGSADGKGTAQALTQDARSNRNLTISPDRKWAVYLSGRDEVRLLDLSTWKSKTLVKDEIWAFQNSSPSFSPDGKYVLFTAIRNFEQDIFVHHIASGRTDNLTNTGVSETSPIWSPDGKSIYFVSNRTRPSYPYGMQNAHIYRLELDNYDRPYRSEKWDELFESGKSESSGAGKTKDSSDNKLVQINFEGLRQRIKLVGPGSGSQSLVQVFRRGNREYLFFRSTHEGGRGGLYRLIFEDFMPTKTEKVGESSVSEILEANGKYFALSNGTVQRYQIDQNKLEPIETAVTFRRNLESEFTQMFHETWAGLDENFYDANFHGVDWVEIKKKYSKFLPYLTNRADLRVLLNDMLGELNSSHLGFSSSGREEQKLYRYVSNETGLIFKKDRPYEVERIISNSPASKLGRDIRPGDVLIAVDQVEVDTNVDRDYYFYKPSLQNEMVLSFRRGNEVIKQTLRPQSAGDLRGQFYEEWIDKNRHRVDSLGNGRIAYSHMKNMSTQELETFLLDMVEQENQNDAIILDLRYNTGGNVHDEVLKFLSQRPYLTWQYRGGKRAPQGHFAPSGKPIVLLINQQSLSDAEMTAAGFRALGLGKIIGTETYRWIIFTSAKGLVDGSSFRVPAWGCYTLDGQNLEQSGVAPDIYVKNTVEDLSKDRDPQLERAVQEILNDLNK